MEGTPRGGELCLRDGVREGNFESGRGTNRCGGGHFGAACGSRLGWIEGIGELAQCMEKTS